jgi:hypothetical protein
MPEVRGGCTCRMKNVCDEHFDGDEVKGIDTFFLSRPTVP